MEQVPFAKSQEKFEQIMDGLQSKNYYLRQKVNATEPSFSRFLMDKIMTSQTAREIHIEVSLRCPHNCIHCSGFAESTRDDVPIKILENRFGKLKDLRDSVVEFVLTGGEPLCREDLSTIIGYARGVSDNVVLFTSGCNGTSAMTEKNWTVLKLAGLRTIVFSVHSIDATINNSFFKSQVSSYTLQSMKTAKAVGLHIQTNTVLSAVNYANLETTITTLLHEHGAEVVRVLRLVSQGQAAKAASELVLERNLEEDLIYKMKDKFGSRVHLEGYPSFHKCRSNPIVSAGCQFGNGFLYIDVNGNLLPCPAVKQNLRMLIGNLDDAKDVISLLNSGIKERHGVDIGRDRYGCLSQASWA